MVAPAGTPTTGGRTGTGTFTVALPTGAVGFIAAVERKAGSVTPPTGWTLLASVVRDSTWSINEIYTAGSSAGTSWSFTGTGTPAGIAVVILGLDGAPTIEQSANASGFTCPTTPSTAGAALIVRVAFNQPAVGTAPTWTYPAAATLARTSAWQTLSSEGWAVAIAASQQASAGAPGTAAYSASPTFGNGAWTLAVTSAGGPTTYQATGTTATVSATTGAVTRLALTLAAAGTIAAASATTGDVTRVPVVQQVTGTIAASSATSGDVTRVPLALTVSGTTAATSATSGDATRVTTTQQATGTTAATTGTTGDVTRLPALLTVSGTTPATTATTGAVAVVGGPATYAVTGATAATSSTTGAVAARLAAAGSIVVVSDTTGVARLVATLTGATVTLSGTSAAATVLAAPVTHPVASTTTATTGTSAAVTHLGQNDGTPVTNGHLTLTVPTAAVTITTPDAALELTTPAAPITLTVPVTSLELT